MNALDWVRNAVFAELMEVTNAPTDDDTPATAIATVGASGLDPSGPAAVHCARAAEADNRINVSETAKLRAAIGRQARTILLNIGQPPCWYHATLYGMSVTRAARSVSSSDFVSFGNFSAACPSSATNYVFAIMAMRVL
jgi:hypothetical protein